MAEHGKLIHGGWLVEHWQKDPIENGALYEDAGRVVEIGAYDVLRKRYPDAASIGDRDHVVIPGFVDAHSHGRGFTTYQMGQPDEPLEMRIIEMATRPEWAPHPGIPSEVQLRSLSRHAIRLPEADCRGDHQHASQPHLFRRSGRAVCTHDSGSASRLSRQRPALRIRLGVRDRYSFTFMDDHEFMKLLPEVAACQVGNTTDQLRHGLRGLLCLADNAGRRIPGHKISSSAPGIRSVLRPPAGKIWRPPRGTDGESTPTCRRPGTRPVMLARLTASRPVGRLGDLGMLSERFSGAHAIWVDAADIETIKGSGAQIVHNPSSNLRLGSGLAPLRDFLDRGIPVAFGLDSLSMNDDEDMFQDLRLGQVVQNRPGLSTNSLAATTMFAMATSAGAAVTGIEATGSLRPATLRTPCWCRCPMWRGPRGPAFCGPDAKARKASMSGP